MTFKFGNVSKNRLLTATESMQLIFNVAISTSDIDFGIAQAARTFDEQLEYFKAGTTTLDPRKPGVLEHAKHVITDTRPLAQAVDIYIWHDDKAIREKLREDVPTFCYLAGHIMATAKMLYSTDVIDHILRWGGNWDRDGVILQDQSFDDLPHFEEYRP